MFRIFLITLTLSLFVTTASAQQYTLKKVCNGRTCYYVRVPVSQPKYQSFTTQQPTIVAQRPASVPVVQQTFRDRPILGGTVVRNNLVGSVPGITTTVVETNEVPTVTAVKPTTKKAKTVEVPELDLLNL